MNNKPVSSILPFLIPTTILALIIVLALSLVPKAQLHLQLCQPHTVFFDTIIPLVTNLVDWLPYVTVVLLLFYRAGWATFLASNLLLAPLALSHHAGMIRHHLQYRNGMHRLHLEV